MVNSIKESATGLALQVTAEAREAGLVMENSEGEPTKLSDVYVYGVDNLLLVIGTEVAMSDRAEMVASAARDTRSIHQGRISTMTIAGNGYQVQLPGCESAGFSMGDKGHVRPSDGVLFIHDGSQTRLVEDLMTARA